MSTSTMQAAGTPAASAAANTVVAPAATTRGSSASTSVVTSTVTTASSPKRTMSLGDDADMEGGEKDEEISSSRRDDPGVGSRRPRDDDSDTSSSKCSCTRSDRPLADAGPLSSPWSGGDSTPFDVKASRTGPVRDPWMPTPSEIESRFGSSAPPNYSDARERYERFSKRPKIERLHWGAVEAGIPCAVPMGIACEHCHVGAVRVSERDIKGYTGVRVPKELKPLRAKLIAQMSSSAAGRRSTLPGAVGDYNSSSSFTPFGGFGGGGLRTPSPFPERPASGHTAAPTYRGSVEILSNEYENDPDLGSGSDDQQFAGRSSELPPLRLAVGVDAAGRRRGSGPPDSADRLEAVNSLQAAEFAALKQELDLLKAQLAQISQTASNVRMDLGSKLAVLRTRVGALEQVSATSNQE
ncbi:unnamed protein product [Phytophthora fragariaefolia]|uniref:Unnamed protein product n=1 Tax=Phytophthora fragariaefolia TaxID=1490495 RepID=A0A9W6XMG2_9STRA|nr:unnamed protein product [Phytophthora fragariaefolia]